MADPMDVKRLVAEVANSNFSDERLNKRLATLVGGLAVDPSLSLPRALDSAGLEGAYRFFSNHRVTPEAILSSHFEATKKRGEEAGDFLIAHDTTAFSYRYDGAREGLGRAVRRSARSSQMLFAHFSLAISADGTRRPLGVAALKTWTRGPERSGVERRRWEEQIRVASTQLGARARAIHLADREADDYETFSGLRRDGFRFVIRCQHNRYLNETSGGARLRETLEQVAASTEREVLLSRRTERRTGILRKIHPKRDMRRAILNIAAATVELPKPTRAADGSASSISINVVRIWEPNPPNGAAPVEWYLYTSEPIGTPEQLLKIADYYRARWTIEEYFKAIKTGCDFESRQLQDYEALVNLLALFAPIAYHLLLIRSEATRDPEQPALTVVSQDQIDVLRARGRRTLSATPTVREIYLAIAALGGHIKYAPNPGWLTLARGYQKLETLTEGWRAAKLQLGSDQR
jgi:Transposase DNA-binding/Transposase DDE domain